MTKAKTANGHQEMPENKKTKKIQKPKEQKSGAEPILGIAVPARSQHAPNFPARTADFPTRGAEPMLGIAVPARSQHAPNFPARTANIPPNAPPVPLLEKCSTGRHKASGGTWYTGGTFCEMFHR